MIARPKTAGSGCPICRAVERILADIGLNSEAVPARESMEVDRDDLCPLHKKWANSEENDWYDFGGAAEKRKETP